MSTTVTVGASRKRRATREESVAAVKRSRRAHLSKKALSLSTKFHKFIRACSFQAPGAQLGYDQRTGFVYNGTSLLAHTLQFNFTLQGVNVYCGGTFVTTLTLPSNAELTSLYDQYRIDWVDCQFMFSNNMSNVTSPTTVLPVCYIAKDYDDSNDAGVTAIQQYATQQTWQLGNQQGRDGIRHVKVKPNVDINVFQTPLVSGYARGKPMLIDTGSPAIPHYGVKLALDPMVIPAASTLVGYFSCNFVYHLTMAHSK